MSSMLRADRSKRAGATRRGLPQWLAPALGLIGFLACAFVMMHIAGYVTERFFLAAMYGSERYAAGLRIVHKHYLSDGTRLPKWIEILQGISTFVLTVPVFITYVLVAMACGIWPSEPKKA